MQKLNFRRRAAARCAEPFEMCPASSVMADDRRSDNVTVSFGLWDPNKSDLSSPLDRFLGDPAQGAGVNDILVPQKSL